MRTLILAILLSGCGSGEMDYFSKDKIAGFTLPDPFIAEDLQPYVNEYIDFMTKNDLNPGNINLMRRVEWVDSLKDNDVGQCRYFWVEGMPETTYWNIVILKTHKYGEYQLKSLMMHEMAHCVHEAEHTDSKTIHIMRPSLNAEITLAWNWDEMVKDLAQYIKNKEWEQ